MQAVLYIYQVLLPSPFAAIFTVGRSGKKCHLHTVNTASLVETADVEQSKSSIESNSRSVGLFYDSHCSTPSQRERERERERGHRGAVNHTHAHTHARTRCRRARARERDGKQAKL